MKYCVVLCFLACFVVVALGRRQNNRRTGGGGKLGEYLRESRDKPERYDKRLTHHHDYSNDFDHDDSEDFDQRFRDTQAQTKRNRQRFEPTKKGPYLYEFEQNKYEWSEALETINDLRLQMGDFHPLKWDQRLAEQIHSTQFSQFRPYHRVIKHPAKLAKDNLLNGIFQLFQDVITRFIACQNNKCRKIPNQEYLVPYPLLNMEADRIGCLARLFKKRGEHDLRIAILCKTNVKADILFLLSDVDNPKILKQLQKSPRVKNPNSRKGNKRGRSRSYESESQLFDHSDASGRHSSGTFDSRDVSLTSRNFAGGDRRREGGRRRDGTSGGRGGKGRGRDGSTGRRGTGRNDKDRDRKDKRNNGKHGRGSGKQSRNHNSFPQIEVQPINLVHAKVEAIVNSANPQLKGGLGVNGAIYKEAGPELEKYIDATYPTGLNYGQAVITPSFNIGAQAKEQAQQIIHVIPPHMDGTKPEPRDRILFAKSIDLVFQMAADKHIRTLAIPPIATGVNDFPRVEAALITFKSLYRWLQKKENAAAFDKIVFAVYKSNANYKLYDSLVQKYFPQHESRIPDSSADDSF